MNQAQKESYLREYSILKNEGKLCFPYAVAKDGTIALVVMLVISFLAFHQLGATGNNGPGPILTHIGSMLEPQEIASTLRNPTPPMPSFARLPPQKFAAVVGFLSELQ